MISLIMCENANADTSKKFQEQYGFGFINSDIRGTDELNEKILYYLSSPCHIGLTFDNFNPVIMINGGDNYFMLFLDVGCCSCGYHTERMVPSIIGEYVTESGEKEILVFGEHKGIFCHNPEIIIQIDEYQHDDSRNINPREYCVGYLSGINRKIPKEEMRL